MRILGRGVLALLALAVVALGLVISADRLDQPAAPDPALLIAKAGQYDVRIKRDEFGVPHIIGRRDADVAFGLGYAHAEDDFATIQTVALATRGTLAARDGRDAAVTDYLVHLFRVWETIEAKYDTELPSDLKQVLEAYADGVNDYAARHPKADVAPGLLPLTGRDIAAGFVFKTPFFYGLDKVLLDLTSPNAGTALSKDGKDAFLPTREPLPIGSNGVAFAPSRSADGATRLLIMFVSWDRSGTLKSDSIHQVGSATLDRNSPHYADRSPLFDAMTTKPVRFTQTQLAGHIEADYKPGERP
ncbi:MAG: penicillin acylase family protein [Aliidongia sp.]